SVFLRMSAEECGFANASLVPIVLVYCGGMLKHNLVRVVDQLSDPNGFVLHDVARLLDSNIAQVIEEQYMTAYGSPNIP
ncbi:hypothetical protein LPJ66_007823, partial [Kickxella alabastrina]